MAEVRLLVDSRNHLGEGPLWDVEEQRLYWIDSSAAEIWSCREDGSDVKLYYVPTHIGSMALREKGGAVLALANGFSLYDFRTQKLTHVCDPEADEQALVFEKFRQGGDIGNRPQGTGLGLPICRRIIDHFGGRIWLESQPGKGACFAFRLPFRSAGGEETP